MINVVPVKTRGQKKDFINLPWKIYQDDPHWVPPLKLDREKFLNPKKNPYFSQAQVALFLAFKNGEPVGRISAHTNPAHNKYHQDKVGFFGFFESIEEGEVAKSLVDKASEWLRNQGCDTIRGPMNFTLAEEPGFLVSGFDSKPFIMNNHSRPYYPELFEKNGFYKAKDLYAWRYTQGDLSDEVKALSDAVLKYPGLKVRSMDKKRFKEEVKLMLGMYNEAWKGNWGYVPATDEEADHLAKELKPIMDPDLLFFVEIDGEPAAFCFSLPNINELLLKLNGRLFPFNWMKLAKHMIKPSYESLRLMFLGIRKKYRGSKVGPLSLMMYAEIHRRGHAKGIRRGELSWTLEDNEKINMGIKFMGGECYKTYRIYEKAL